MATLTDAQLVAATFWLEKHIVASQQIRDKAEQTARATWLGFEAWYSAVAVAAVAREMAALSNASQNVMVGSAQTYIANVVSALTGGPARIPQLDLPPIRNGATLELVHRRPAQVYKKSIATGMTPAQAEALAVYRAGDLQVQDMSLVERSTQQYQMKLLGITTFRRVVRPELSKTGSCGLCIAASDQIYGVATLMPMHDKCKCLEIPIIGELDPGNSLNNLDLAQLYADAGSTSSADLKRTRYTVNEHGEYGPTLGKAGDNFRGPDSVPLENDPARAKRMLLKALPVLERMESTDTAEGPLSYQRDLVARLSAIAA